MSARAPRWAASLKTPISPPMIARLSGCNPLPAARSSLSPPIRKAMSKRSSKALLTRICRARAAIACRWSLNGKPLGFTKMDKLSKTVAFPFPAGTLMSGKNTLSVTPALTGAQGCSFSDGLPSLLISAKSALIIDSPRGGALDLGSFAAGGAPFSDASGALTDVYLTGNESGRISALKVLAKAAQTSGEGWTAATFLTRTPSALSPERNALILGPLPGSKSAMLSGAPRALQDAVRGRISSKTVKTASGNANQAFALAARQTPRAYKAGGAGIAAVYAANDTANAVGIISAARSSEFNRLVGALIDEPNWSDLSGSVASWDKTGVTLLQAADSRLIARQPKTASPVGALAQAVSDFNSAVSDRFSAGLTSLAALKPARDAAPVKTAEITPAVIRSASVAAAPKPVAIRVAAPVKIAAPTAVAVTPAILRGRSDMQIATAPPKAKSKAFALPSVLDWSGFDADYFKANLAHKTQALFGKTPAVKSPAAGTNLKQDLQALLSGDVKSKGLLILLVSVMALMLLGLAAPTSSNKNIG